jgi:hypothetical protein
MIFHSKKKERRSRKNTVGGDAQELYQTPSTHVHQSKAVRSKREIVSDILDVLAIAHKIVISLF